MVDETGTPVPLAKLEIDGTFLGVATGAEGTFRLRVPNETIFVRVVRIGFYPIRLQVEPSTGTSARPLTIQLVRHAAQLRGVVVPGERSVPLAQTVTRSTVRHVPPLGEPDVMRALPFLPGISQPNDMLGRIHLAGSAGDETLFTLDGHPLQSPTHLSGIMGGFNIAAIDRVEVLSHHVPAVQPTRLGGVVALRSRERHARPLGEFVGSLLASSVTVEETRLPGGVDLLASARLTYMDQLYRRIYGPTRAASDPMPSYGDVLLRIGAPLGGRMGWRTEGIGFLTRDWTAVGGAVGARARSFSERLIGITVDGSTQQSRVRLRLSEDLALARVGDVGDMNQRHLDLEQRWRSAAVTYETKFSRLTDGGVSFGIDQREHLHVWSFSAVDNADLPVRYRSKQRQSLFSTGVTIGVAPSEREKFNLGARMLMVGREVYLAPRIQATWHVGTTSSVGIALDRRYQFDSQFGEPLDGGVTPPTFLLGEPIRVDAIATTYETSNRVDDSGTLALSATLFARAYSNRRELVPSADTSLQTSVDARGTSGRSAGLATGVTWSSTGGFVAQGAYTFSQVVTRIPGGWRSSGWEIPHTIAVLMSMPLPHEWTFTMAVQVRSGAPVTPALTQLLVPSPVFPGVLTRRVLLGEANSARLPASHRLDLAVRKRWTPWNLEVDLSLQAVNVMARDNVLAYDWQQYLQALEFGRSPRPSRVGIPFVPSVGIEVRW